MRVREILLITFTVACATGSVAAISARAAAASDAVALSSERSPRRAAKMLLEFGWDRPTPDFVRRNMVRMDGLPFDGFVATLHVGATLFTHLPLPAREFERDRTDLSQVHFIHLTENFLLVWATPEDGWDWFNDSDWAATEQNLRSFARTAKAGHFRGLFFDTEPYGRHAWYYPTQPHHSSKSFAEYEAKLRERGAQFMRALEQEMPDAILFLTWGPVTALPSQGPLKDLTRRAHYLAREGYGLLPAFVTGGLQAIRSGVQVVDGNERSYFNTRAGDFANATAARNRAGSTDFRGRAEGAFRTHYRFANAIYVDWIAESSTDPSQLGSYLHGEQDRVALFEQQTAAALIDTDRYTWIYAQKTNWWADPPPEKMIAALARAKSDAAAGRKPDLSASTEVAAAVRRYEGRVEIDGMVRRDSGGVPGVTLLTGATVCATTNLDGYYRCVFPAGWRGTLTPKSGDLRFNPPLRAYDHPTSALTTQDFEVIR